MYDGPVRGGSRGGQGDFRWDDVKNSKHRENYLGATVNAPVGRWQNNRDVHWYSRETDTDPSAEAERRKEEIRKLKEQEEEALSAALGYVPSSNRLGGGTGEGSGANSIPVSRDDGHAAKEQRRREKELRKEERAQKRLERQQRREGRAGLKVRDRDSPSERGDRERRKTSRRDSDDEHYRSRSGHHRSARGRDGERSPLGATSTAPGLGRRRSRSRSRDRHRGRRTRDYSSEDRLGETRDGDADHRSGRRGSDGRGTNSRRQASRTRSPSPRRRHHDESDVVVGDGGGGRAGNSSWIVDDDA